MTTQSTANPEVHAPQARRIPSDGDGRSATDTTAHPELKARLRQMVDTGKTRMTEWKGGFQGGIRAKPIQSVLIATAIGAVVGLIIGRRS